jgi:23S rRNA pseudouridine1911/1915/1917 synthase
MSQDRKAFDVRATNDGATLVSALRKMLGEDTSWGELRKLISNRHIHVNGNLCLDEGRRLKKGDVVHVFSHSRSPLPTERDLQLRHLDEHLVVIEKPAGLNTLRHREEHDLPQRRKDKAPTVDELLARVLRSKSRPGQPPSHPPPQPRAVHRLDRDTSGLMLFALTPQAEQTLEADFARHAVERVYLAVVHGHLTDVRRIESHFVRDRGDGLRGSFRGPHPPGDSQRALTHVRPLETVGPYTLVECRLETGRTHQIRIHLSEAGHRLCGEKTYTHPLGKPPAPDTSGAPRQVLHSASLKLTHPASGKVLEFESPFPKDLAGWLARVRGTRVT